MTNKNRIPILLGIVAGILCLVGTAILLLPATKSQNSNVNGSQSLDCDTNWKIPPRVRNWCRWIDEYAVHWQVNPLLIAAIIQQESGGNASAISRNGAVGLMQIMPGDGKALAFECISGPCFSDRPPTQLLLNPEYNISYGAELIANLLEATGNLREALHAYGPMEVGYDYADQVLSLMEHYQ